MNSSIFYKIKHSFVIWSKKNVCTFATQVKQIQKSFNAKLDLNV